MQALLKSIVDSVKSAQFKAIFEYLLNLKNHAKFGDYIFLLFGSFAVCYLFFFRLQLHLEYGTLSNKEIKKRKKTTKSPKKANDNASFFRWIFMYDSYSFRICKSIHPRYAKVLFVYNFITVSVCILAALLIFPSFFHDNVRSIFIDVVFLHLEINVIPVWICSFIHILYRRISN